MKIWTYGCSFTAGYEEYYLSDKTWPYFLDIGVEYEVENRGHGGGGFYNVREHLLNDIGRIKPSDLVILQLPSPNRVVIPYFEEEWSSFMKVQFEQPKGTIGWLKYMKTIEGLIEALGKEADIIFRLLNRLDITWVWWTAERPSKFLKTDYGKNLLRFNEHDNYVDWIYTRTEFWNNNKDWHQNANGHEAMAVMFSSYIRMHLYSINPYPFRLM